jgi:hypothetical protein
MSDLLCLQTQPLHSSEMVSLARVRFHWPLVSKGCSTSQLTYFPPVKSVGNMASWLIFHVSTVTEQVVVEAEQELQ